MYTASAGMNDLIRLRRGSGLVPLLCEVPTLSFTLNSLHNIKLFTLTQNPEATVLNDISILTFYCVH